MANQYTKTYWFKMPSDPAITIADMAFKFIKACNKTKDITILGSIGPRVFPGNYKHSFMLIVELAESHASMCTYPEDNVFTAQLSTCGNYDSLEDFRRNIESQFNTVFITEGDSCEKENV